MTDSNKDTLNINDINTLYPLRVATYVKMSFKIYRKDLKVTGECLVMFKFDLQSLKVEEVIVMIACLKSSELFHRTTVSILFCLKTVTLQFKVI